MVATISKSQAMSIFNADEPAPGVDPQFSCFLEDARAHAVLSQMTQMRPFVSHSNMDPLPVPEGAATLPRARVSGELGTQWRGAGTTWESGVKMQQEWQLDQQVPLTQVVVYQDIRCVRLSDLERTEPDAPLYHDREGYVEIETLLRDPDPKARSGTL